ncbi:hypothetical protein AYK21_03360 [Thermoplasmatales archaeon SG8-52-2]|nr:MAG: hypothetical protein AYK21_03360 [Thermoplasmatales archaeon SG8-52-2]
MGGVKIKKPKILGIIIMIIFILSTVPIVQSGNSDDDPPVVTIVNPTKGYFHFSGIKLVPTIINIVADTMGFGGFRVRPVRVQVEDDVDPPEDISVYMYVKEDEQGIMTYNNDSNLFERKWIGPDLGVYILNITAEDSGGNIGSTEMEVWYFCFIPE